MTTNTLSAAEALNQIPQETLLSPPEKYRVLGKRMLYQLLVPPDFLSSF